MYTRDEWAALSEEERGLCKEWAGRKHGGGYGVMSVNGKEVLLHRHTWITQVGPLTRRDVVCHHCDNPPCYELSHLFVGTQADNLKDMHAKGRARQGDVRGENNPRARLTQAKADEIRARYIAPVGNRRAIKGNARELAAEYGVSLSQVQSIIGGRSWS